jgi:CheY-like chemotaxis protein
MRARSRHVWSILPAMHDPRDPRPPAQALVADDDRVTALMLSETLKRWALEVTVVGDGAAAFEFLRSATRPTLAVLDWMMPVMHGPDVCRRVRAELPLANLYLILLTAREGREDLVAGLEAGADDYVTKPFDLGELRARVRVGERVLSLQERLAERVTELEAALTNVQQLRGLLPICSYCKRIRNDEQYWEQVETYITTHSGARFSHGICPACYEKVAAELDKGEIG